MHPLLIELARRFDHLTTRDRILEAIFVLEALYDSLEEIAQETVARLIADLNRRLGDSKA